MFAFIVRSAVLAAASIFSLSAAASSTVSPALVSGTYYEQNGVAICEQTNACEVIFSKPPAGRALTIQRVACDVISRGFAIKTARLGVFASETAPAQRQLPLAPARVAFEATNGSVDHFTGVYRDVRFPVAGRPGVRVFTTIASASDRITMECQIAGELSP